MIRFAIYLLFIFNVFCTANAFAQGGTPDVRTEKPGVQQQVSDNDLSGMTDIFDIKAPEPIGINPAYFRYLLYALVIFLALALLAAGIFLLKKRQKKIEEIRASIEPEEAAYRQLDELAGFELSRGKEFYFRLSAVLRDYIRDRFQIDAPEMTTEELIPRTMEIRMGGDLKKKLKMFLLSSDPIKFANLAADQQRMIEDLNFVRGFVKETTPVQSEEAG